MSTMVEGRTPASGRDTQIAASYAEVWAENFGRQRSAFFLPNLATLQIPRSHSHNRQVHYHNHRRVILGAERSIEGPPMSMCSIACANVVCAWQRFSRNG